MRRLLPFLLVALLAPATAWAEAGEHEPGGLAQAKEEHGDPAALRTRIVGSAAQLRVDSPEWVAGTHAVTRIEVSGAAVRFTLPALFTQSAPSGLRYARVTPAPHGDSVIVPAGQALTIADLGLPARTYALRASGAGTVHLRVFEPSRDGAEGAGAPTLWRAIAPSRLAVPAGSNPDEQSETWVTVPPADPDRIVAGYNDTDSIAKGPTVSDDGGSTFTELTQPNDFDVRGKPDAEANAVSGDPMAAADTLGNVWFGGLSSPTAPVQSRIYVNRIDRTSLGFQPRTVGLDYLPGTPDGSTEDKPLMTVDNSPSSPTYGRIYVAWDNPGQSGVFETIVHCDTRVAGLPAYERCDDADNWSAPAKVLDAEGSYIYADLAVGPDGTVYYTYWDHSAQNAIRGTVCRATPRTLCGNPGTFSAPRDIAVLDTFPGQGGVPFACPTLSAPGGRTGPVPGVEVDDSYGPNRGRVYVSWGDLRANSGQTRCAELGPAGSPPSPTNRTWDVYAASALNDLPFGAAGANSAAVGTKLSPDAGTTFGVDDDDDFFPWLATDAVTGQTWIDWYSTRNDPTRRTTEFEVMPIAPTASTKVAPGTLTTVSGARSDYSTGTTACCIFGNDYGDYTGLAAAAGEVVPIWTQRDNGADNGDPIIATGKGPHLQLEDAGTTVAEDPAASDGDGQVEPGDTAAVRVTLKNPSTVPATGISASATVTIPGASVATTTPVSFPAIAPKGTSQATATIPVSLPRTLPCPGRLDLQLTVKTAGETEYVPVLFGVSSCTPSAGGGAGGAPGSATAGKLSAKLTATKVKHGRMRVKLRCSIACKATLSFKAGRHRVAKVKRVTLKKAGTKTLKIRVKLRKGAKRLTVGATVKPTPGGQALTLARRVKLTKTSR